MSRLTSCVVEAGLGDEFARHHLAHQGRGPAEDADFADAGDVLDDAFHPERMHLVPADVEDLVATAGEVATIAVPLDQVAGGHPVGDGAGSVVPPSGESMALIERT